MIRPFKAPDLERILDIWLEASARGHSFVAREFWESKIPEMRSLYLPSSETYVYDEEGAVKGFISLRESALEALFVSPESQGRGVGSRLLAKAKEVRPSLRLNVYRENSKGIEFYRKRGFQTREESVDESTGHPQLLMVFTP